MNKLMPVLFSVLFASSVSYAQTHCTTDVMGNTVCRDNQTRAEGNPGRNTDDAYGNTTSRENRDRLNRGSSDSINRGSRRDSQGGSARSRNNSSGNTIYRDNRGHIVRCGAGSFGDPGCR